MSEQSKVEISENHSEYFRIFIILVFSIIVGVLNYTHVAYMQENNVMFSHLSNLERELSFRTEMGFYYSFYKQVITTSGLASALNILMRDNLTEYPSTINALQRFNLFPELVVGNLYRYFIAITRNLRIQTRTCYMVNRGDLPSVQSCEGLGEPAIFYVNAVLVLNGVMMSFFFLIGYLAAGKRFSGGILTCLCYFYNHRECTRVQWTPPLRESFSYPFLVIQQFFLLIILNKIDYKQVSIMTKIGFMMSTLISLLSWQFAQFALLTQTVAIFISYLIAGTDQKKTIIRNIFILLLIVDFANIILQFGNTLLITGPLTPCIIMAYVIITYEPLFISNRLRNSILAPLRWILLLLLLIFSTALLKYFIGFVLQIKSDDHVFDILRSKFSNFRSFDSLLYTCAPEFDFYDISSITQLNLTGLLPIAMCSMMTIIFYTLYKWLQMFSNKSIDNSINQIADSGFCDIKEFYLFFQTFAYMGMAGLIMRLKLFATPHLCIIAALICNRNWPLFKISEFLTFKLMRQSNSNRLQSISKFILLWPVILIFALCSVKGIQNLRSEWDIHGSYSNWDQEQLMDYIISNTGLGESFTGQMATMATVRLVTGRPITIHPHYEDEELRKKVHLAYSVYSKKSIKEVWLIMRSTLGAKYLIYEHAHCQLRPNNPGCSYLEMWDVEDPNNQNETPLCMRFEEFVRGLLVNQKSHFRSDINNFFKWKFTTDNLAFSLFEVLDVPG